jgi:hypothetical protein
VLIINLSFDNWLTIPMYNSVDRDFNMVKNGNNSSYQ